MYLLICKIIFSQAGADFGSIKERIIIGRKICSDTFFSPMALKLLDAIIKNNTYEDMLTDRHFNDVKEAWTKHKSMHRKAF